MTLKLHILKGEALRPHIDSLAALRMTVFREYPYLYEGTLEYERKYLQKYAQSASATSFLLYEGDQLTGASTCLPLLEADPAFREPFCGREPSSEEIFYFGESILLPAHRGRGYGKKFFQWREEAARASGNYKWAAFCAVDRAADDPRKPADARDLRTFWQKTGYTRRPEFASRFSWKEIGQEHESEHTLTFWLKNLVSSTPAP